MSSPFAALGLGEDADERAVKRAYAQRLKSARPDEDPEAFQALNGAYKAALAAIRWRAQAQTGAAEAEPPPPEPLPPAAPALAVPQAAVPEPVAAEPVAAEPVADDLPFAYATPRDDGGIEFDFDAFAAALFEVTADPDADLGAWLQREMADWPLAMKPTLAPYLLAALDDDEVAVSPQHFATLVAAFGLDDVHAGVDPVAVELLRKANEQRWTRRDAVARARRLLDPKNRRELDKAAQKAGYPSFVGPMLARLVTGPQAESRATLRWLPMVAKWVMKLLRSIGVDVVQPSSPISPKLLAKWAAAGRDVNHFWRIGVLSVLGLVLAGFMVASLFGEPSGKMSVNDILAEEKTAPDRALQDYAAYLADRPAPWSDDVAKDVAIAMRNRSLVLERQGRTAEALRAYAELDRVFSGYADPVIRLQVAKGLVSFAFVSVREGDYQAAIDATRKVADRYSGANDEEEEQDSFDLLVVKALNDRADAFNHLGNRLAAAVITKHVLDRHKTATAASMKDELEWTREIKQRAETGNSPPQLQWPPR